MSTFTVTNTNNSGAGSLRQAVLDANALSGKDMINFGGLFTDGLAHTISLTGSGLSITDNLTIQGTNPNLLTIKDDTATRVFDIGKGVTSAINGLTITNIYNGTKGDGGGGIFNEGVLTLSNSIITGNTINVINGNTNSYGDRIGVGGGIYNTGNLTLDYSSITGNSATYEGGGIYNTGNLTLDYSNISNNRTTFDIGYGGGISSNGSLSVNHSTITGNDSGAGGGISSNGRLTVNYSNITGNSASDGGGIYNTPYANLDPGFDDTITLIGSLTVNYSNITGNSALRGGGIYSYGGLTVTYSNITGNSAFYEGGGIFSIRNSTTINYSTISDNILNGNNGHGGGIYSDGSSVTLNYSIINGNQAHFGGGIYNDGGTLTVGNSTIRHNKAFGIELSSGQEESGKGGGIYNSSQGTATIDYSTIACNFDTPQEYSNKPIKPDDLVGKFISKGHDNRIGNISGSTFSYS